LSTLHVISGKKICKTLKKVDYFVDYKIGSHIILFNSNKLYRRLSIPNHKEAAKSTLRKIIRESGLSIDQFLELYKKEKIIIN
jgi:predicted RNA binding protein YcfA (HicA-like mRNA interferase family)